MPERPGHWTEPVAPDVAEAAVHLCGRCPVFELCDAFAVANREVAGIWAGRDRQPKRGRPAAQPKGATV